MPPANRGDVPEPDLTNETRPFHYDLDIAKILAGVWVTSFDLEYPEVLKPVTDPPTIVFHPYAFVASFHFKMNGTFTFLQLRNKAGAFDQKPRSGSYTAYWAEDSELASGALSLLSDDHLVMSYMLRNTTEMHWLMHGPNFPAPVAQGIMRKAELFHSVPY